jgi:hypothetical protein
VVYHVRKDSWRDPKSDFAPFTWEAEGHEPGTVTTSAKVPAQLHAEAKEKATHGGS